MISLNFCEIFKETKSCFVFFHKKNR